MTTHERFDPAKLGERSRPAYDALLAAPIWDGTWRPWHDVIELMLPHTDIQPRSCSSILKGMAATGIVEARGEWRMNNDRRELCFPLRPTPEDDSPPS